VWKQTRLLNHPSNRPAQQNRIPGHRASATNVDFAVGWRKQSIDEFQRGGFPCATSPEQDHCLSRGNREADVLEQPLVSMVVTNFSELDDWRGFGALVRRAHSLEWYRTMSVPQSEAGNSAAVRV